MWRICARRCPVLQSRIGRTRHSMGMQNGHGQRIPLRQDFRFLRGIRLSRRPVRVGRKLWPRVHNRLDQWRKRTKVKFPDWLLTCRKYQKHRRRDELGVCADCCLRCLHVVQKPDKRQRNPAGRHCASAVQSRLYPAGWLRRATATTLVSPQWLGRVATRFL